VIINFRLYTFAPKVSVTFPKVHFYVTSSIDDVGPTARVLIFLERLGHTVTKLRIVQNYFSHFHSEYSLSPFTFAFTFVNVHINVTSTILTFKWTSHVISLGNTLLVIVTEVSLLENYFWVCYSEYSLCAVHFWSVTIHFWPNTFEQKCQGWYVACADAFYFQ
jgi:hypothetical protein